MKPIYHTPIYLNIYDLSPANCFLYPFGLGIHHSAIEINGVEYTFAEIAGIFEITPKQSDFGEFRGSIKLGEIQMLNHDIRHEIYSLSNDFKGSNYDVALKNCNTFSNAVCEKLLKKKIPGYVNRLANIGEFFYLFFKSLSFKCKSNDKFNGCGYKLSN